MLRLKQLCRKKGITQREAARDLGIRENTFSQYATGQREADYATLTRFADYFDCSTDFLLGRARNLDVPQIGVTAAARNADETASLTPAELANIKLLAEFLSDEVGFTVTIGQAIGAAVSEALKARQR